MKKILLITCNLLLFTNLFALRTVKVKDYPKFNPVVPIENEIIPVHSVKERGKSPGTLIGYTWYDHQSNASMGRQKAESDSGWVHFFWMCAETAKTHYKRHVRYNYWDPIDQAMEFSPTPENPFGGIKVGGEEEYRSGFVTGDALSDGRAVAFYHTYYEPSYWISAVAVENIPHSGKFSKTLIDTVSLPMEEFRQPMWPHGAVDADDYIHVCALYESYDTFILYYSRSTDYGKTFSTWKAIDTLNYLSYVIAGSRIPGSGKVGIAYTNIRGDLPRSCRYPFNDLYYVESTDNGATWGDIQNITNFTKDTLNAFCDCGILFDNDDQPHIAFTTYWNYEDAAMSFGSKILHWSPRTGITLITDLGWHDIGTTNGSIGMGRLVADKPSLAIEKVTGILFCIFVHNDSTDISEGGFPNGDIWGCASLDDGKTWLPPINLTHSPSPGAPPGECDDDDYPSVSEEICLEMLKIMYVNDKDAGASLWEEGAWTLNPVLHLSPLKTIFSAIEEKNNAIPSSFVLQSMPNPFLHFTAFNYQLPVKNKVSLKIYDITGRSVKVLVDTEKEAGKYNVNFNAKDLTSGIYFAKFKAGDYKETKKLILMR